MAKKTPTVKDKIFTLYDYDAGQTIMELDLTKARDWSDWQVWLNSETTKSFRYVGADKTACSVVKELRPQFGDKDNLKPTWYAHKRLGGKLRRRYLGVSENLSYKKLKQVAFELSQRELV